eukprot:TRINITY_DN28371_c0_g2_i3.p3 TRINITY_DN28371_c0_g2~~TRINITY_DN28371_c0_g2_i3.p3  ORF type:complete len:161 (+),score=8.57 TRINITY_DN28371_c0_g2_i3:1116-1598(+)
MFIYNYLGLSWKMCPYENDCQIRGWGIRVVVWNYTTFIIFVGQLLFGRYFISELWGKDEISCYDSYESEGVVGMCCGDCIVNVVWDIVEQSGLFIGARHGTLCVDCYGFLYCEQMGYTWRRYKINMIQYQCGLLCTKKEDFDRSFMNWQRFYIFWEILKF